MRRSEMVVAVGAALAAAPRAAFGQTAIPIRVGTIPGWTQAEGYLIDGAGMFAAAGLDPTLVSAENGGAMTAALMGGSVDVATTNTGSMASAYAHGLPIALFAPSALSVAGNMTSVLCVMAASAIRGARDLAGKTIAFSTLRDLQQASALTWIAQNGGDVKASNYVEIPLPQMFGALKSGRIDVAMFSEPFYAEARDEVRVIGRPYEALGRVILTSGWVAKRDWLSANPVAAQRFVSAVRATARWVPAHQAAMLQILGKATKMAPEILARMGPLSLGESLDPAQIQPIIDAEARFGYLPHGFPASEMIVSM